MILTIDIGNTNIVFGLFEKETLKYNWRYSTAEAYSLRALEEWVRHSFLAEKIAFKKVEGVVIGSVVPSLYQNFLDLSHDIFSQTSLWVTPSSAKIPLRVEIPEEVGADRLCNAVAAWEKYKQATIVVDFGTATTLDIVTNKGEYGGGAIFAGMEIANLSLARSTAQLFKVPIAKPKRVVGRNTLECLQAGLYHGYVGMVDHLVQLSIEEEGTPMKVVATGGLASLISGDSKTIQAVEPFLTLEGMWYIWTASLRSQ